MTQQPPPPASGFDLGDIYYALFRHKRKIAVCTVLGIIGAVFVYKTRPPLYQSQSKVLVKYVVSDNFSFVPGGDKEQVKSPDMRGETIMETQQQTLTSLDLSRKTAEAIGPKKILANVSGNNDLMEAAGLIHSGLKVSVPPRASVMTVVLSFKDPEMVQEILRELILQYQKMHSRIYQSGTINDLLQQQRDTFRNRVSDTEQKLLDLRNAAGVLNTVAETRKEFGVELAGIAEQIRATQVLIGEKTAVLAEFSKPAASAAGGAAAPTDPSMAKTREYSLVIEKVSEARKRHFDALRQYQPGSSLVLEAERQVNLAVAEQTKLETENPELLNTQAVAGRGAGGPVFNVGMEAAAIAGLQERMNILVRQYESARTKEAELDKFEPQLNNLERQRVRENESYMFYAQEVEKSAVSEQFAGDRAQNIEVIESATPAFADWKKTYQTAGMVGVGGLGLGIAWALAIELYFDRSVRRPRHLERLIKYPLFLSIPAMKHKASKIKKKVGWKRKKKYDDIVVEAADKAAANGVDPATGETANGFEGSTELALRPQHPLANTSMVPWDKSNELHPFHETLRDRLIGYFESRGLTHKPKVVGVTGLTHGSGVTTTAAGLAASLSETGDGNVLLVDLTPGRNSSHEFFRGKPAVGLDQLLASRDSAQIHSNLFVASDSNQERMAQAMPHRFSKLVPQLKASDFDYIIFDMPPVSQISITPRLAGFMDMVLMVVESEKTHEELVKRASSLLAESKAHVGVVLNKTKNYVPKRLYQDGLELQ